MNTNLTSRSKGPFCLFKALPLIQRLFECLEPSCDTWREQLWCGASWHLERSDITMIHCHLPMLSHHSSGFQNSSDLEPNGAMGNMGRPFAALASPSIRVASAADAPTHTTWRVQNVMGVRVHQHHWEGDYVHSM